jgi:threonylcarbamoyladenosine tRNA methylthiotransferase MtaB
MNLQPKVKFITLGCKVNQYETQGMREALKKAGAVSVAARQEEAVDVVVVNTCTVTAEADKENRYWIRRARREHPQARIIVTGCGVERNRADYERLAEVDMVLMNHEKAAIAERLLLSCASPAVQETASGPVNPRHVYAPLSISETEGYNGRAFVKIQDGCNHACSFCKVVMVRGRSRSRALPEIVEEVVRLRDAGYREVVFAGIQLGAYGLDNQCGLVEVLEACSRIEGIERLRLSSIEPTDVTPDLIQALRDIPECCPQLHIPLQSGDDAVLTRMNRRYERSFYIDLIARLRAAMPDFCLTMDVMAGFPGEEEIHFENTIALLREVRPLKSHVFPYSRREGTMAARYADVPKTILRERVQRLIALGQELSREIRLPYLGKTVPVLAETYKEDTGLLQGLSPNYLKVHFPGSDAQVGQIISVKLVSLDDDGFRGVIE